MKAILDLWPVRKTYTNIMTSLWMGVVPTPCFPPLMSIHPSIHSFIYLYPPCCEQKAAIQSYILSSCWLFNLVHKYRAFLLSANTECGVWWGVHDVNANVNYRHVLGQEVGYRPTLLCQTVLHSLTNPGDSTGTINQVWRVEQGEDCVSVCVCMFLGKALTWSF